MDLMALVIISALSLMAAAALEPGTWALPTNNTTVTTNTSSSAPDHRAAPTVPTSSPPSSLPASLAFIAVTWTGRCQGHLILYPSLLSPLSPAAVCHGSETTVRSLVTGACENRKGCKDLLQWSAGSGLKTGYHLSEGGAQGPSSCLPLQLTCPAEPVEVQPDVEGQLKVYKVVTALLCCVLLVLLLIRFTRPTVKALQNRLSDRRQSRWVGPTQSHSVSYHRGKTVNNDDEKRLSYPALERLTVSDSREPSSNRNSGCNL